MGNRARPEGDAGMIKTQYAAVPNGDGFRLARIVAINEDIPGDIIRDVKAIASGLISRAKDEAAKTGRQFTEADRLKIQNAFVEGMNMSHEEIRNMDKPIFDGIADEIAEEMEKMNVRSMS